MRLCLADHQTFASAMPLTLAVPPQAAAAALRGSLDALAASTDEQLRAAAAAAATNANEAAATVAGSLATLKTQTDAAMAAAAKASMIIIGAATRSPSLLFPLPSLVCFLAAQANLRWAWLCLACYCQSIVTLGNAWQRLAMLGKIGMAWHGMTTQGVYLPSMSPRLL